MYIVQDWYRKTHSVSKQRCYFGSIKVTSTRIDTQKSQLVIT